jgi:hypothetical protein
VITINHDEAKANAEATRLHSFHIAIYKPDFARLQALSQHQAHGYKTHFIRNAIKVYLLLEEARNGVQSPPVSSLERSRLYSLSQLLTAQHSNDLRGREKVEE